ncbi:MAG: Crp/Fnr family transcriptional regulator [Acidobacteria bacterium]|nr:Crp/Fnr family transcriptional regulator [Acidobacteriota bacterium]
MSENRLLAALPKEEYGRLEPYLELVRVEFKQLLIEPGVPIPYVWFPHDFVTSDVVEMADGSAVEVGTIGNEGMAGTPLFLRERTTTAKAFAQVPGAGMRMRSEDFIREVIDRGGPLHDLLHRYTHAFLSQISQTAACNRLHTAERRMCRWILMMHDRVKEDRFPLTQEFMSLMLGVTRQSVSATASELQEAGLITYTRGMMTVLERRALEASACECYERIRQQFDRIFEDPWPEGGVGGGD